MEVVIWKVVLPNGSEVKGTGVGETRPMVCEIFFSGESTLWGCPRCSYSERHKDSRNSSSVMCTVGDSLTFRCSIVTILNLIS